MMPPTTIYSHDVKYFFRMSQKLDMWTRLAGLLFLAKQQFEKSNRDAYIIYTNINDLLKKQYWTN